MVIKMKNHQVKMEVIVMKNSRLQSHDEISVLRFSRRENFFENKDLEFSSS